MEEIHLFSVIFTIREFSHWPEELIFVHFHNTCQLCVCRMESRGVELVHILPLHILQLFKSQDRTVSIASWAKQERLVLAFESMANNILCPDAQNPSLKFTHGNACKRIFLSFKDFPSPYQFENQLFSYDKSGGEMGTYSSYPRKGNSSILLVPSCDLIDPRSCFQCRLNAHISHMSLSFCLLTLPGKVSVSPVVIIHFQITVTH